jgi:hypothetical protein
MAPSKEEIMFQIEILYDFAEGEGDVDSFVAERISRNFSMPLEEARKYIDEYKAANQ